MRYTVGWKLTDADEHAIALPPETASQESLRQDGQIQDGYHCAELTGLNTREGWPDGMRLIVRRVRPSGHRLAKLTAFEKRTGWRYSVTSTNIRTCWASPAPISPSGSTLSPVPTLRSRTARTAEKATGLRNLPSKNWTVNQGWMLALHDQSELECAEPDTRRYRLCFLPARLAAHARRRWLRLGRTWPWADTFVLAWQRLTQFPAVT